MQQTNQPSKLVCQLTGTFPTLSAIPKIGHK